MLGENLRKLAQSAPSISALCRDLKVNRTQFNRYLAGESFPRPDILYRICAFFDVDARILLQPIDDLTPKSADPLSHPQVAEFFGHASRRIGAPEFPTGFYRFARPSFMDPEKCVVSLVYVFREDGCTFVKGYEPKHAMGMQGLYTDARSREYRGVFLPQEGGVIALVSRRNTVTTTFNFLTPIPSIDNNFWLGYATRTSPESVTGPRVVRMIYEHLGNNLSKALQTARLGGLCDADDLLPFQRSLLRLDEPFN